MSCAKIKIQIISSNLRIHAVLLGYSLLALTISLRQAIVIGFANSIDPDETAHMSRLIWIYAVWH